MKLIAIACLCLFLLPTFPAFSREPFRTIDGFVVKVSDGDTLTVDSGGTKLKVRLYGIDAPETGKINRGNGRTSKEGQPFGQESQRALWGKVYHRKVRIDVMDIDRYRRLVSLVRMGNRNINLEMIREGWSWAYRKYLHSAYASEFIEEEELARRRRAGLWQDNNPRPPWEFRKSQRMDKKGW